MLQSKPNKLTDFSSTFLQPSNSTHRHYEALRGFFIENLPVNTIAQRFGYTPGSLRVLLHQFRKNPKKAFFLSPAKGPQESPKKNALHKNIITLRKQNFSIYDISRTLAKENQNISPVYISRILKEDGFARLPRRKEDHRSLEYKLIKAPVSDVRQLNLSPSTFRTKFGGLFLFLPYLARIPFDEIINQCKLPGSEMIPAAHAMRCLLALKLFGCARHSHVMGHLLDKGLALFCGINEIPKRSFLTEYSCRIDPATYPKLMRLWFDAATRLGLGRGKSFDLDFHTIPFHGEDALIEKHYVSKRSRRQKGILAFVAKDADKHVFCYANAEIRKKDQNNEVMAFIDFWKQRTGHYPEELIFDSKLTTYANLYQLSSKGVLFITLRRRTHQILQAIYKQPDSAWQRIQLKSISRAYRTPRILDQIITLADYPSPVRQIAITDLGHEEPTLLLTNQLKRSATSLIERYAKRMIIENRIQDGIDFFHMDALSSSVALKINCDLQLTLMASSLYRMMAQQIARGYESAKSRTIFRNFIEASATITITESEIIVRFQKRAHNPLLIAAGLSKNSVIIPWLDNKKLTLVLG